MKRHLLFLTIILAFVLVGCGNKAYDEAMDNGKNTIEEMKYDEAVAHFEVALEAKKDDDKAIDYLVQTEIMIRGIDAFAKGELDEAKDEFTKVGMVEDASTFLQDEAAKQLEEIKTLEKAFTDLEAQFNKAKKLSEKKDYEQAMVLLEDSLELDESNPYMDTLKADMQTLQTDLEKAEEKAAAEAKKKAEEEEKEQAEKDSQQVNKVLGYWLTVDETMACHITESYMACAVAYSDVIFNDPISSIKGNPGDDSVTFTFGNGTTSTVSTATDGVLHMSETLKRVSKEQANGIYDGYYELP